MAAKGLVDTVQYQKQIYTRFSSSKDSSIHPSDSIQPSTMSFSETLTDPIPRKRNRTLSERVTENGDPLVIKKKARAAEKASTSTAKKINKAGLFTSYFLKNTHFLNHN
jgi:hypothetical protein